MNCWSRMCTLLPAKRRYSSKMLVRDHSSSFRRHPTTHPVRCVPLVQWIRSGRCAVAASTSVSAWRSTSSSEVRNGSMFPATLICFHETLFSSKNLSVSSGKSCSEMLSTECSASFWRNVKFLRPGKPERYTPRHTRPKFSGGISNSCSLSLNADSIPPGTPLNGTKLGPARLRGSPPYAPPVRSESATGREASSLEKRRGRAALAVLGDESSPWSERCFGDPTPLAPALPGGGLPS
mmetsp:Transcript_54767/g.130071  ORF Transcript_54767/g.130071 Transcript_54767/m.130071 type:complete len:237 (-) Transcript_54767:516-1226(-)